MAVPRVNKEDLVNYHFINHEVLESEREIYLRRQLLDEAMILGNGEKHKVKIVIETTVGPIMVETTVWETTDSHVELKSGLDIPIYCIRDVIIY